MTLPTLDKTPVTTRTNRGVLLLVGLLLLGAGILGLVVSFGGFGTRTQHTPVLDPAARSFAAAHDWFWLALAVGVLVVVILTLLWLRAQLSTTRVRTITLEGDRSHGATSLAAAAVERACAEELQSHRGIGRARAVMLGDVYDQRIALFVSLDGRESLQVVDDVVLAQVLPKIRQALEAPELPMRIEYKLARQPVPMPQ